VKKKKKIKERILSRKNREYEMSENVPQLILKTGISKKQKSCRSCAVVVGEIGETMLGY
jgi:hypothetical protein